MANAYQRNIIDTGIPLIPNWAPNERFLPNADYGRVGALKLVNSIFKTKTLSYTQAGNTANDVFAINVRGGNQWGQVRDANWVELGKYHFYLLGRDYDVLGNDGKRAALEAAPEQGSFSYGRYDLAIERDGPLYFSKVMREISTIANTYGFNPSVITSAILTIIKNDMISNPDSALVEPYRTGYIMAKFNPSLIDALWGITDSGYPKTYNSFRNVATRGDYGGGGGRGRRRSRRKRTRYM